MVLLFLRSRKYRPEPVLLPTLRPRGVRQTESEFPDTSSIHVSLFTEMCQQKKYSLLITLDECLPQGT